jgi:hypothetical protein
MRVGIAADDGRFGLKERKFGRELDRLVAAAKENCWPRSDNGCAETRISILTWFRMLMGASAV